MDPHSHEKNYPTQAPEDVELVRRVAAGDRIAGEVLVERHLRMIVGFAFRLLGDMAEAEDVAQETFLRLWKHADRWEPRAKLSTWLHHVARNLCIDRLRLRRGREGEVMELPDLRPGVVTLLESRQRDDAVQRALSQLAERQRSAIVLVYYQGLSNREAAQVLGVEVDALESLLARGRRTLRKLLMGVEGETAKREIVS